MAEDTWNTVALPLLDAISQVEHDDIDIIPVSTLADRANLDPRDADSELELLMAGGYVRGRFLDGLGADRDYADPGLAPLGARATHRWPPEALFDALVETVDVRMADETLDPATKNKLQKLQDSVLDIGQGIVTDVLAKVIASAAGLQ